MERHDARRLIGMFVFLLVFCGTFSAHAQEACGLQTATYDILFANGFDLPKTGLGQATETVLPPTLGTTPTITITAPASGATLAAGTVQVSGTVTGSTDTGVSVNGVRAYINNGHFLTKPFTLQSGSNTLTATATSIDGLTATATESVSQSSSSGVTLSASVDAGFSPASVVFSAGVPASIITQSLTIDFGDGSPPYTGTSAPSHAYTAAGIYTAQLTLTDNHSVQYTSQRLVAILSTPELRRTLCSVYALVRTRLAAGDAPGALNAFHVKQQQKYGTLFTKLGANMPTAATRLGTVANGIVGINDAELILVLDQSGQVNGYPLHLSPDISGVWRIDAM